tara:strand:+ start:81 stop:284 length:204 start_codon:yes stop_codon:yes gene_type:complete
MLMDWPTIWATTKMANMIQARWMPFGKGEIAEVEVVVTAMVVVQFKEDRLIRSASLRPFGLFVDRRG